MYTIGIYLGYYTENSQERCEKEIMRRFLTAAFIILITLTALLPISVCAAEGDDIGIFVDGNRISGDKAPVIINSRTLLPIRPVAEACGIDVDWNGEKREVILRSGVLTVTLGVGNPVMTVYNQMIDKMESVKLDAEPLIIDSSTYIAVRPALEAFGAVVEWNGDTRTVIISSPGNKNNDKNSNTPSADNKTPTADTEDKNASEESAAMFSYTGFREMENHTVRESAPHGLYGRIKTKEPITYVRCRIADTKMDYALFFKASDNLTNYNVFTYFDKLICFSDAGVGNHIFEVYAAVNGKDSELIFSYEYTVISKTAETEDIPEDKPAEKTELPLIPSDTEAENDTDKNGKDKEEETFIPQENTGNKDKTPVENQKEEASGTKKEDDGSTVGYYGFIKMPDDKIAEGAPHGLYGNIVSNYPITEVRCRIAKTDMDYTMVIPKEDEVYEYNLFTFFDELICFSEAGKGNRKFELFVGVNGKPQERIFSYSYKVVDKSQIKDTVTEKPENNTDKNKDKEKDKTDSEENKNKDTVTKKDEEYDVCMPLEGTVKVTSPYGFRAFNKWEFHKGVDIISSSLNIIAVADGTVVDCATGRNSGVGNYVAIQHDGGWVSLYYHLASYDVEIGDKLKKGEKFATMGNTGGNYGVHLHFMTCDKWYGTLWSTQNNHHTAPHEYIPQLLTDAVFYNPSFEKTNKDKMILCNFRFPTVLEKGRPFSISNSGAFAASDSPLESITLTIFDENGKTVLCETVNQPEYTVDGIYTYTPITVDFDKMCEFDLLPTGKLRVEVTAESENGRERTIYWKEFEVVEKGGSTEKDKEAADAVLTPEEASKTDAFEKKD